MSLERKKQTLFKNKYRYLSWILGFLIFVGPFSLLTRLVYMVIGNISLPDLHTICLRMPLDWVFSGRVYNLLGSPIMTSFTIIVLITTLLVGPMFCGWLCPVGAVSEALSRLAPIPKKFRLHIQDPNITRNLRFGFLTGFILVSILVGLGYAYVGSICCRYCTSSVLQNIVNGLFGNSLAFEYWHTGSILTLIFWLLVGGIFTFGGRGWCILFCPLGAVSGLIHAIGAKIGFYRTVKNEEDCKNCGSCSDICPMWAIGSDNSIERTLCINCKECINRCPSRAFSMIWGRRKKSDYVDNEAS
ncbi:MAG: 4Fe-4S binding protein [Candidatus Methanomethyliaceae archaeon]|nr:4Fe-4S binding protein [Candidatus Methanomethyliaceae archaeon]